MQYRGWCGCSGSVSDGERLLSLKSGKQPGNGGRCSLSDGDERVLAAMGGRSSGGEAGRGPVPLHLSTEGSRKGRLQGGEAHEQGFQGVLSRHSRGGIHQLGRGGEKIQDRLGWDP